MCLRARGGKDGLDHRGERGAHLRALPIAQHRELRLALALVAAAADGALNVDPPSVHRRLVQAEGGVDVTLAIELDKGHAPRAAALAIRQQTNPHAPDHTRVLQESSDLCLVCSVG